MAEYTPEEIEHRRNMFRRGIPPKFQAGTGAPMPYRVGDEPGLDQARVPTGIPRIPLGTSAPPSSPTRPLPSMAEPAMAGSSSTGGSASMMPMTPRPMQPMGQQPTGYVKPSPDTSYEELRRRFDAAYQNSVNHGDFTPQASYPAVTRSVNGPAPLRSNMAPPVEQPNAVSSLRSQSPLASYGRPSFMPDGGTAPLRSNMAPPVNPNWNPNSLGNNPATPEEMDAVNPQSQVNIARRSASTNPLISGMERDTTVMENKQNMSDEATATGTPIDVMQRRQQVTDANRAMDQSPRGQRNAQDAAGRAEHQAFVDKQAPIEQAKLDKVKNQGIKRAADAPRGKNAIAASYAKENAQLDQGKDRVRNMNIKRYADGQADLKDDRRRREMKAAANNMMQQAMGQRDPRVKAAGIQAAKDLAAQVGNMPNQQGRQQELDVENIRGNAATNVARARYDGEADYRDQTMRDRATRTKAYTDKIAAEIEAKKNGLSPEAREQVETLQIQFKSELDKNDGTAAQKTYDKIAGLLGGGGTPTVPTEPPKGATQKAIQNGQHVGWLMPDGSVVGFNGKRLN